MTPPLVGAVQWGYGQDEINMKSNRSLESFNQGFGTAAGSMMSAAARRAVASPKPELAPVMRMVRGFVIR